MAIGMTIRLEGMTADIYDAVNSEMGFPAEVPDGLIRHSAGPVEGGWRVCDVWESQEKLDRFNEERLMPALGRVEGADAVKPAEPEVFEVHNLWPS